MRIIILLFLMTQFVPSVFGQKKLEREIREDRTSRIKEIYYLNDKKEKEGEYKYIYSNHTQVVGHYQENRRYGLWIYTPTKDFKFSGTYVNDLKTDKWIYVDEKDTLAIMNYKNGKLSGSQLGYYKNGKIATIIHYNDTGQLHGELLRYYPTGTIQEVFNYVNGELHGDYLMYLENGKLITKLTFCRNTPINLENFTNDSLLVKYSGNLANGSGILSTMTKNLETNKKQVLLVRNYKDSLLHGEFTGYYFFNGNISYKGQYHKGYMDGKWTYYNANGEFDKEKHYSYSMGLKLDSLEGHTTSHYDEKFSIIETMPKYLDKKPEEFRSFIAQNLKYPITCARKGIQGRVFVQFYINNNGEVNGLDVVRSAHPLLDEEAVRVVGSSPFWIPGMNYGIPVTVQFTFPINFVLQ